MILQPPLDAIDILVFPIIALFFGVLVFFLGIRKEIDGDKAMWKWAGAIILAIGAFASYKYFFAYIGSGVDSQLYRDDVPGRKMMIAHYGSFLMPVLGIIGMVVYNIFHTKKLNYD